MKDNEKRLASSLLKDAAHVFSNHGCNDVDESHYDGWTKEDRQQFVKEFHDWNGDPEEYDPEQLDLPDWLLMDFLAFKLKP